MTETQLYEPLMDKMISGGSKDREAEGKGQTREAAQNRQESKVQIMRQRVRPADDRVQVKGSKAAA